MPEKIQAHLVGKTITSNDSHAHALYKKSNFGEKAGEKIQYSLSEALFLVEKGKLEVLQGKKTLSTNDLIKRLQTIDKKFSIKYPVYKDLRERGYIVKTALKFGADFRVYPKGKRPGKEHAKWVVFVEQESSRLTWHEFSAKNRVAHSTRKNLLLALVDEESGITYYEVSWIRP
ncbi:MAG: tRNA-intron lyase [Candidatus Nanoarchaeia archaeon]